MPFSSFAIDPKDIPFGEIVAAFPFDGKVYVVTHYRIYIHDPKDPEGEYKQLPVLLKGRE